MKTVRVGDRSMGPTDRPKRVTLCGSDLRWGLVVCRTTDTKSGSTDWTESLITYTSSYPHILTTDSCPRSSVLT